MRQARNMLSTVSSFWQIKFIFILSMLALLIPSFGGTAFAYNRGNAVIYADQWALSRNGNYASYGADCTNFASQALDAGGYQQVWGDGNTANDNNWFGEWNADYTYFLASHSWYNAGDHYQFQVNHFPGGYLQDVVSNSSNSSTYFAHYDAANMIGGDELFYDWDGNGTIDHMAFQVNSGWSQYSSSGWYGDLSDQHVTDRYHVSWNHIEVNPQWPTTVIWEEHIDNGN